MQWDKWIKILTIISQWYHFKKFNIKGEIYFRKIGNIIEPGNRNSYHINYTTSLNREKNKQINVQQRRRSETFKLEEIGSVGISVHTGYFLQRGIVEQHS